MELPRGEERARARAGVAAGRGVFARGGCGVGRGGGWAPRGAQVAGQPRVSLERLGVELRGEGAARGGDGVAEGGGVRGVLTAHFSGGNEGRVLGGNSCGMLMSTRLHRACPVHKDQAGLQHILGDKIAKVALTERGKKKVTSK